jgi:hypothetical protein
MSIRGTLGKLMVIGIALAILGIMPAKIGSLEVQGQKRIIDVDPQKRTTEVDPRKGTTTDIDQVLVKIVPAKPVAPLPTIPSKDAPFPLSPADKQRLLQSVLTSLQQQSKANPTLKLENVFPLVVTPSIPPGARRIVLTTDHPKESYLEYFALSFMKAFRVATLGFETATWLGDNADGDLDLDIGGHRGQTLLLDFTVDQFRIGGGSVTPMEVNLVRDFTSRRGGRSTRLVSGRPLLAAHMEMGVTRGHILVPFIASEFDSIEVFSRTGWSFHSVEITILN